MGFSADGAGRAGRRIGAIVAAAVGAAVVAAAVAGRRRRRDTDAATVERPGLPRTEAAHHIATPADGVAYHDTPTNDTTADAAPVDDPPVDDNADDDTADDRPPDDTSPSARHLAARPRRRRAVAVGIAAAAVLAGVGAVVAGGGSDQRSRAAAVGAGSGGDDETGDTRATTTTTVREVTPQEAFGLGGQRLVDAGSFSYTGTASATDVSHVRPTLWLAVDLTVEGQVVTSTGRVHEVAVAADGRAAETVTDGPAVWGRSSPTLDDLTDEGYEAIPELSDDDLPAKGAGLLPTWLAAAVDPVAAGPDELGRRTFRATIPADVLGEIERGRRAVDATVVLTLDGADDPVRVDITSAAGGPPLHLVFDLSDFGVPVSIEAPV
jgi:hypothetical protein